MSLRPHRLLTLADLCVQTPRQVKNWPSVLHHDIRTRMGRPGIPRTSEILLRDGTRLNIYPRSAGLYTVFADVYLRSCYDRSRTFKIHPRDTIIDIGANVGFFTAKAARRAYAGRILAFEPCPPHFAMLERNMTQNHFTNVSISSEAIWSGDGLLEFRYSTEQGNLREPMHTSVYDIGGTDVVTVRTVSLNRVFEREKIVSCDLLKLDCEGAEYEILYSAAPQVLQAIQRIAMEWHRFDPSHDPKALVDHLDSHGFRTKMKSSVGGKTGYIFGFRPEAAKHVA